MDKALAAMPARSTKGPVGTGYVTSASDLAQFQELGKVPCDIQRLNDGKGIECILKDNNILMPSGTKSAG